MFPEPGQKIDLGSWVVDDEFVAEYLGAVDDGSLIYSELGAVPPMALAARALGALLNELALPPGTIHAAQELDCTRTVSYGEKVSCFATLSRPRQRGAWKFVTADFHLRGIDGIDAVSGKSTVLVPVDESAS